MTSSDAPYQPPSDLPSKLRRRWTRFRKVAPLGVTAHNFILSISFDDVPDCAATIGAALMDQAHAQATWYIATGLLGQESASGRILDAARIRALAAEGHEIALHSHSHRNLSVLPIAEAVADIERNRQELAQIMGRAPSESFAYPYGETSLGLKQALLHQVESARGIAGHINAARDDRMQLAAFDLRPDPRSHQAALSAMETAARDGGWVILFSHDVRPDPSPYGVTPQVLQDILAKAAELGAEILPVGTAYQRLIARGAQTGPLQREMSI